MQFIQIKTILDRFIVLLSNVYNKIIINYIKFQKYYYLLRLSKVNQM